MTLRAQPWNVKSDKASWVCRTTLYVLGDEDIERCCKFTQGGYRIPLGQSNYSTFDFSYRAWEITTEFLHIGIKTCILYGVFHYSETYGKDIQQEKRNWNFRPNNTSQPSIFWMETRAFILILYFKITCKTALNFLFIIQKSNYLIY